MIEMDEGSSLRWLSASIIIMIGAVLMKNNLKKYQKLKFEVRVP
jgi:hypothetical protein